MNQKPAPPPQDEPHPLYFQRYVDSEFLYAVALRTVHFGHEVVPPHVHDDFYELSMVLNGDGFHYVGREEPVRIFPGYTFLMKPQSTHCYRGFSQLMILNLLFVQQAIDGILPLLQRLPGFGLLFSGTDHTEETVALDGGTVSSVNNQMENMMNEQLRKAPGYELSCNLSFQKVLLEVCRQCHRPTDDKPKKLRLIRLLDMMSRNLGQEFDLEQLAMQANMSTTNFRRSFRELTGMSPIQYLIALRIRRAGDLLLYPGLSVKEVAEQCGFHDLSYFSRQFCRILHVTPGQWRKKPHGLQYMPWLDWQEGRESNGIPLNFRHQ